MVSHKSAILSNKLYPAYTVTEFDALQFSVFLTRAGNTLFGTTNATCACCSSGQSESNFFADKHFLNVFKY